MNGPIRLLIVAVLVGMTLFVARIGFSDEPQLDSDVLSESASTEQTPQPGEEDHETDDVTTGDKAASSDSEQNDHTAAASDDPQTDRITWVGTVASTFEELCVPCHQWGASYGYVAQWIETGDMAIYLDIDHFISGEDKQHVLEWIQAGYPEQ